MNESHAGIKLIAHIFAGLGVSKVVNDVIQNNTNIVTTWDSVRVATGSLVIGSLITEPAARQVDRAITTFYAWRDKYQSKQDPTVAP